MTEDEAVARAADHNRRRGLHAEPRHWLADPFDGGWLVTPRGDDLADQVGYICLVVLDDGRVYEDGSTLPPSWTVERYRSRHGRLMPPESEAAARAADLVAGQVPAGAGTWSGIRFAGGWLVRLLVDVDQPATDLAWVVVLDDGSALVEPVGGRLDAVVARHEIPPDNGG